MKNKTPPYVFATAILLLVGCSKNEKIVPRSGDVIVYRDCGIIKENTVIESGPGVVRFKNTGCLTQEWEFTGSNGPDWSGIDVLAVKSHVDKNSNATAVPFQMSALTRGIRVIYEDRRGHIHTGVVTDLVDDLIQIDGEWFNGVAWSRFAMDGGAVVIIGVFLK